MRAVFLNRVVVVIYYAFHNNQVNFFALSN